MHDLDALRRRLWLAVLVGAVGCEAEETKPSDRTEPVAQKVDPADAKQAHEQPERATEAGGSGGMSSVVQGAMASAAANAEEKRKLAAAEKAAFAASTCTGTVDRVTAAAAKEWSGALTHGCPPRNASGLDLDANATERLRDAGDDDNCCYRAYPRAVKGRPYTVDGAPRLPGFSARPTADPCALQTVARRRIAAGWLHDAREELASVAAFERAALELAQLGAPQGLIDAYGIAAAQEHRHAALCLSIAEDFAARSLHLGPPLAVEPRRIGLLALLLETFEEGCAGEAIAATIARRSARGASDRIGPTLVEIADDETEHAALAWRTLAWGLPRLTDRERASFFATVFATVFATATVRRIAPPAASVGLALPRSNAAHGRMSPAMQARVADEVWTHVIRPLMHDLRRVPAPPN